MNRTPHIPPNTEKSLRETTGTKNALNGNRTPIDVVVDILLKKLAPTKSRTQRILTNIHSIIDLYAT